MSNYDYTTKARDIDFCYHDFDPRPRFLLEQYKLADGVRYLFDSEISVYMAIVSKLQEDIDNYCSCYDSNGDLYCMVSQQELGNRANRASRLTVRRAIKTLVEANLVSVKPQVGYEPLIYLIEQKKSTSDQIEMFPESWWDTGRLPTAPKQLYVIWDDANKLSKVGISVCPIRRLGNLVTKLERPLKLVYATPNAYEDAREIERSAHDILSKERSSGEWFSVLPDTAIEAIEASLPK